MYNAKYFTIEELVTHKHYVEFSKRALWRVFDDRILKALDMLRKDLGPIVVNNWMAGGGLENCGLRFPSFYSSPSVSQHIFGRAMDLHVKEHKPKEVRKFILDNQTKYRPVISRLEGDTDTWVHIDICNSDKDEIIVFGG